MIYCIYIYYVLLNVTITFIFDPTTLFLIYLIFTTFFVGESVLLFFLSIVTPINNNNMTILSFKCSWNMSTNIDTTYDICRHMFSSQLASCVFWITIKMFWERHMFTSSCFHGHDNFSFFSLHRDHTWLDFHRVHKHHLQNALLFCLTRFYFWVQKFLG